MKLTWNRVDLMRGFIMMLCGQDTKPKPKTLRQVPMTPAMKFALIQVRKSRRSLASSRVFLYLGKPIQRVSRSFQAAMTEAKITDFRFHDLCHCGSINLSWSGVDTTSAKKIIGHTSGKMWQCYSQAKGHDLWQSTEKIARYLRENTPGTLDNVRSEESDTQ